MNKDIDIIIITAHEGGENAKEAVSYGVRDFITKPFNPAEIYHIMNRVFESRNNKMKIKNLVQKIENLSLEGLSSLSHDRK